MSPVSSTGTGSTDLTRLLEQLPPLAEATAPGLWPLTPAWYLLITAIIALLIALVFYRQRHQATASLRHAQREAQAAIDAAWSSYQQRGESQHYVSTVNSVLKRFALQQYPNQGLEKLSGQAWLKKLDALNNSRYFTTPTPHPLTAIYQPLLDIDEKTMATVHRHVCAWLQDKHAGMAVASKHREVQA